MKRSEPDSEFELERASRIAALKGDAAVRELSLQWNIATARHKYTYNFTALGRPIIQLPQDMIAVQELIWKVKPDLIVETGIAHGGSLMMSASCLALLDFADAVGRGTVVDPRATSRRVLGIDIEIRNHNLDAIAAHPLSCYVRMIQGSSVSERVLEEVRHIASGFKRILVMLDSNHSHDHVLAELKAYGPLVSTGSYCIVFDTVIEDLPDGMFPGRPWEVGNNPKTAVHEFLRGDECFEIDREIEAKLQITVAPDGYLRRVR